MRGIITLPCISQIIGARRSRAKAWDASRLAGGFSEIPGSCPTRDRRRPRRRCGAYSNALEHPLLAWSIRYHSPYA
jgi:hypothetical protein